MLGIIPRGRVLLLGHRLAGVQVHHLQGLLVRFQIGVVGVGEAHGLDLVGEVGRQLRLGVELVFDLLAGLDDFAVHALLVAALARLGHDVLLDRWDVAADLRFVGRFGVVVHGLGAAVGQVLAGRCGAEGELVARGLAVVLADLFRALAVGEVDLAGDQERDLLRVLQSLEPFEVGGLGGGGGLGALDCDVELVGHVLASVDDVAHAAFAVGARFGLVDADVLRVGVEDVVGGSPVVREDELLGRLDQILADGAVDDAAETATVEVGVRVAAGLVGLLRVDDGLPSAVLLEDPGLVRVRLPGVELLAAGVGLGLLVPLAGRVVLDLPEVLRLADGDVKAELDLVVQWHLALVGRAHGGHGVRGLVPSDLELAAHVAVVVALVDETVVVDGAVDAVGGDLVLERHLVAALAGAVGDDGAVGHAVRAHALVDGLDRRGWRFGAHAPGLGRILVGRVDGRVHPALLGDLDVDPVLSFLPVVHAEVGGRGEVVEPGVAVVGEGDRLADRLGGDVAVLLALVVDDGGAVQAFLDAAAVVARVQDVADRVGGADLQIGPLPVRGGDAQRIVRRGGLVLVKRDDDDAGRAGHVPFHELVHARGRIIIKRGRGLIVTSPSIVVIAWCDVLVPVVLPHALVVDAGPVPYAGGRAVARDRADRDDTAVAVALAWMALVETVHATVVRILQRGCGLAG
ncbi:Uncharacterised protein [Bifidobacterium pseudocatenulatum]|uniref:NAD-specific glutamate dehydrogenase n=1 Tax=Bifidobacterium pseudocatenulatum TaxID=28026 RepID=A0AAX3IVL3_BIFPS|nr:Uncharacterised protein [Bifidobacterium pseudocatenulatum]